MVPNSMSSGPIQTPGTAADGCPPPRHVLLAPSQRRPACPAVSQADNVGTEASMPPGAAADSLDARDTGGELENRLDRSPKDAERETNDGASIE